MGLPRFLYSNLITAASMITVSSLRTGLVSSAVKDGSGSAVLTTSGNFSGSEDLEYTVEIDSIAGGAEVGQATFKWSDGGGSWDATGVTTAAVATLLNNGVSIAFTTGSGADFVVGDKWYFKGINLFNSGKVLDLNRDTRYRAAALGAPNTITIDLGSAQEVKALVIYDHNLTAAATIALKGHTADDWGSPDFSEAVTFNAAKIVHYLSVATTKRYWRVEITDAANTDSYIEIGELYLGSYFEPAQSMEINDDRDNLVLMTTRETVYGIRKHRFFNLRKSFRCEFAQITESDMDSLETLLDTITDRDAGTIDPFYFNPDSATPNDTWMVELKKLPRQAEIRDRYTTALEMDEVVKSV